MKCRFCAATLDHVFLDLGTAPPSNAYLDRAALDAPETWFPLKLYTCASCLLVQVDEVAHHAALFSPDYAYFSSYSSTWLAHARTYVDTARTRLALDHNNFVVELASNDGYLLQYMRDAGIPCLGIEPTRSTALAAQAKGIETWIEFFGVALAQRIVAERGRATLVIGNNVLAHVPDLNDFVAGIALLLAPDGVATLEFPHLQRLVAERQFDTVYHEHFSYFSLHTVERVFAAHGMRVWDVERLPTHGGSLRVWACANSSERCDTRAVAALLAEESSAGMLGLDFYAGFQAVADGVKDGLLTFLLAEKAAGRRVAGYGAAAKGNTLLNYAGVRQDLLRYVVDASPHKQGRYLPGSRIPIVAEEHLRRDRPDTVLILPWNLQAEIHAQLSYVSSWRAKFVVAIPELTQT